MPMTRTRFFSRRGRYGVRSLMASAALSIAPHVAQAQTVAITGGRVFTVSGPPIDNATVLIRDGRIVAVGAIVTVPSDAQRIDAAGKWVTPGLINAGTRLGIGEIGLEQPPQDASARVREGIAAAFTAWEGSTPA